MPGLLKMSLEVGPRSSCLFGKRLTKPPLQPHREIPSLHKTSKHLCVVHGPITSALGKLRREGDKFKASLGYMMYYCDKNMTKIKVEEERVYFTYTFTSLSIIKGSQAGTWRQGPKHYGGVLPTGLLIPLRTPCPPAACPSELGPPTYIVNQENVLQTYLQAHLLEAFSQLRVPFPK